MPLLEEAVRRDPRSLRAWFVLARCHDATGRNADAVACYGTAIALEPEYPWSYFNRGLAHLRQKQFARACADFDKAIAHKPQLADAYINRALAYRGLAKYHEAIADLTKALDLGAPQTRIYFMRALVWDRLGPKHKAAAQANRAEGLKREPTDEKSWIARALARKISALQLALADLDQPAVEPALGQCLAKPGHVLADFLPLRRSDLPFPACLAHYLLITQERFEHIQQAIAALTRSWRLRTSCPPVAVGAFCWRAWANEPGAGRRQRSAETRYDAGDLV